MSATATEAHPTRTIRGAPRPPLRLLTVAEAADYLSVSVRFVRRIIHERRIPVVSLGRHVRLAEADLEAFVAAGRQPAASTSFPASARVGR
ncbi:MAG: helix-turn-helix domain-containing protein [Acidimicrobiales bacterium]